MDKSMYREAGRSGPGHRIGMGLLMALSVVPGGLIVLRALTLPRSSPGLPDLCPLHRLTGMWCPLCGGTRATRELIHGDLWGALGTGREGIILGVACAAFAVVRNLPGMWIYLGPLLGPPG